MNAPPPSHVPPLIVADLETKLSEAQRYKTLAEVPALRRLAYVARVYFWLTLIAAATSSLSNLVALSTVGEAIKWHDDRLVQYVVVAAIYIFTMALYYFQPYIYWRFGKQFRANHLLDLADTIPLILRIQVWGLFAGGGMMLVPSVVQGPNSPPIAFVGVLIVVLIWYVFYSFMRRYVRAAEAELPTLMAVAGTASQRGVYKSLRTVLAFCAALAAGVCLLGLLL